MSMADKPQPAAWARALRALTEFLATPGPFKTAFTVRQCINLHKILVVPVYLAIMSAARSAGGAEPPLAAWLLLVCHGIYGWLWVFKDIWFPDPSWQVPMSPAGFIIVFSWPLGMYYMPMYCLVLGGTDGWGECPGGTWASSADAPALVMSALTCYTIGMFYHFGSDIQKHVQLAYQRPRNLITTGLFAHCRNPNYFGGESIKRGRGGAGGARRTARICEDLRGCAR